MTKLLAAINKHAEALAFARDLISRVARYDEAQELFKGSMFDPAESRNFLRKVIRGSLLTAEGRMWLVDMALAGEEESRMVLREALLELKSRGEPLPAEFEYYNMRLIRDDLPPTLNWQGPKAKNEFTRNIAICCTVAAVRDHCGLKPTGRSARYRSACSIVAEALAVIGINLNAKAVESVWRRYGHNMPVLRPETGGWIS